MRIISSLCCLALAVLATALSGCGKSNQERRVVGVSFETLQTEFWVAAFDAIQEELKQRDIAVLTAVADGDANRQLQQIRTFLSRNVDGIIVVPKDNKTILPAIKASNQANVPIVVFNRPADTGADARAVTVVADNRRLARETVAYMVEQARATGRRHKAMIVVGDLGDTNAVERRQGFHDAIANHRDVIDLVAEIPSEWTQERARAGVTNALQANPDIGFIFTSSDFLFPSIVAALRAANRYHPIGHADHVILGGFDGDATAFQMLRDKYLDATGVQDVYFESAQAVQALVDQWEGRAVPETIFDPGFVIHQGNLEEKKSRMWGAQVSR